MPKIRRNVTSKQVAERAGVSQTTVSFVLNEVTNSNISEETRQRVLQAAHDLNYVPDMAARALASGRSNTIGLILSRPHRQVFIDEYIPNFITGLTQTTQKHGFRILIQMLEASDDPKPYLNLIRGKEVDGVVVSLGNPSNKEIETLVNCTQEGLPIVASYYLDPALFTVSVDTLGGVRLAIEHLIKLGHRRIACIGYGPAHDIEVRKRLESYYQTLHDGGIEPDSSLVRYGSFDPETGCEAMNSLLDLSPIPSAVFAMNDVMAFGAIQAIHEHGLRVPEDVAIVGFDGIRLSSFSSPALTTIYAPDIDKGRLAGEMLIKLLQGDTPLERHVQLGAQLVIRDSCGANLKR
jgi:DNA-binding LacI/PurR family transcriptional regulator